MNALIPASLNRREFLITTFVGAALAGLSLPGLRAAQDAKKIPIGLQLYSVRFECEKNLPAVLEAVGKMGFNGVEFAGYYGRKAPELRKMLDDNGLVCCGTHTPYESVSAKNLAATIEFNRILGNKFLIVPYMEAKSRQGWLDKAKEFNELADKVKAEGLLTGYHAHGGDFKKYDGETAWDLFFSNTKPEVIMQLDTSNCMDGGADPVAVLKKYPGRARTIHIKEFGGAKDAVIGGGVIKWSEVFALCEAGGTEWFIIEHERGGPDPIGDVKRCLEAVRKMGR